MKKEKVSVVCDDMRPFTFLYCVCSGWRKVNDGEERTEGSLHLEILNRTVSFSENPYLETLFN